MHVQLKIGDILLLPRDKQPGVYTWVAEKFGTKVADFLSDIEGHEYIHQEMYIGGGFVIAAWFNGVHIISYPLSQFAKFHVYRHPQIDKEKREKIKQVLLKYFNKPYDFISLILNGIPEILSLGFEPLERFFESKLPYDNPNMMICSELVARIYKEVGVYIEPQAEFVTPDDLQEHAERLI